MGKLSIVVMVMIVLMSFAVSAPVFSEDEYDSAYGQAVETSQNTASFDGGYGSTINTYGADTSGWDVPDIGEGRAYGTDDE